MADEVPGDAALRDLVRDMITSGAEEHLAMVETLSITSLQMSAPTEA